MFFWSKRHAATTAFIVSGALVFVSVFFSLVAAEQNQPAPADPWSAQEILRSADLFKEISAAPDAKAQTIIYVGFRTLFEGGHLPGATFHGTASNEKGLADLKSWLARLPPSTNLVIYCGCCPFDKCPNIRPAYKAIHEMGFAHVRVLMLPTSFAKDWVEKGYAIEKGL